MMFQPPPAKKAKTTRVTLSGAEKLNKLDAYRALDEESKKSLRIAADNLGMPRESLRKLLMNEEEIRLISAGRSNVKRNRIGKDAQVEDALFEWWKFQLSHNAPLNGLILCSKAEALAKKIGYEDFRATDGWFTRWKARHGIVSTKLAGEAAEADVQSADEFIKKQLPDLLRNYAPRDILNTDETGICFRALPSTTFVSKTSKRGQAGFKTAKDRITALVTCAMDGTKEDLLIIGKTKSPRCFKNMKKLPLPYDFSSNAWMVGAIWERWLR